MHCYGQLYVSHVAWVCPHCGKSNVAGTRFCGHCGVPAEQPARSTDEERRLVTALFADLSGFTSLAERLDLENLLDIMDPLLGRLTQVVARYGGRWPARSAANTGSPAR